MKADLIKIRTDKSRAIIKKKKLKL